MINETRITLILRYLTLCNLCNMINNAHIMLIHLRYITLCHLESLSVM